MAAATEKAGPVKGQAGIELRRGDKVRVGERAGQITGFSRDKGSVYVRFDEKGDGPTPAPIKSGVLSLPGARARVLPEVVPLQLLLPPAYTTQGLCTCRPTCMRALHRREGIPYSVPLRVEGARVSLF